MHSKKLNVQLLVQAISYAGIEDVVISPGSRNAPLILEFSENDAFNCYSIIDERSAAFFALGMAQQSKKPVVLCCTSGSAMANYYPAVTEAFYQNIPLVILTADRPENYTDIFDGQTIRQKDFFEKHVHGSFQFTEDDSTQSMSDNFGIIKKALSISMAEQGPVHINLPFSEPLYDSTPNLEVNIDKITFANKEYADLDFDELKKQWLGFSRKMILVGMLDDDPQLQKTIYRFADDQNVIILSESTSNLHHKNIYNHIDALIFDLDSESFKSFSPDLLLTVGQNIVSKKIKQLLRNSPLKAHWHLDEYWKADTFFQLKEYFQQPKNAFLSELYEKQAPSDYYKNWDQLRLRKKEKEKKYLADTPFCDLKVYEFLSENINVDSALQFGNSSAVRYSQLFDFNRCAPINANRGTSGIEGSLATAIGAATKHSKPTVFITGDIGFFYESNSLWNQYIPSHFKIILINNGGGEIFNFINGPDSIPKKSEYLTTQHHRNAKLIAEEYRLTYFYAHNFEELKLQFDHFQKSDQPAILEIDTSGIDNSHYLKVFLQ